MMIINRNYNLFLDDIRHPFDAFNYTKDTDFLKLTWFVARNYDEFTKTITDRYNEGHFPKVIAFDHDLADAHYEHLSGDIPYDQMEEKTGMHCARWLVDFCLDRNLELPDFKVHSQNPAGKANIDGFLNNFKKHQQVPAINREERTMQLEAAADIISRIFHYGNFKAETASERTLEGLLTDLGYYPTSEDKIILRPSREDLYQKYKNFNNEQSR